MMHRKVFIDGVSVALQRDDLESRHTHKGLEDLPYLAPTTAEGKVGVKQPTNIKGPQGPKSYSAAMGQFSVLRQT